MSEYDELSARLERYAKSFAVYPTGETTTAALCNKAAEAIRALLRERDEARAEVEKLRRLMAIYEARLDALAGGKENG